jgi:hypothetical protein
MEIKSCDNHPKASFNHEFGFHFLTLIQLHTEHTEQKTMPADSKPIDGLPAYDDEEKRLLVLPRNATNVRSAASQEGVKIVVVQESILSPGLILFIVGFVFMPAWWIAAALDANSAHDRIWRTINRSMTAINLTFLSIMFATLIYNAPEEGYTNHHGFGQMAPYNPGADSPGFLGPLPPMLIEDSWDDEDDDRSAFQKDFDLNDICDERCKDEEIEDGYLVDPKQEPASKSQLNSGSGNN